MTIRALESGCVPTITAVAPTKAPTKGRRRADVAGLARRARAGPDAERHVTAARSTSRTEKGTPYLEFVSVDALVGIVAGLPAGTTELGCHPRLDGVPG